MNISDRMKKEQLPDKCYICRFQKNCCNTVPANCSHFESDDNIADYFIKNNNIIHPNHYSGRFGLETIDVIRNFADGHDAYEAYCAGNIIKYACRWVNKGGYEDIAKIKNYCDFILKHVEKEN